jgi:hypothetical protein
LIFVNFQHHRRVLVPDLQRKKTKQNRTKQKRVVACLLACPPQFSQEQDNLFGYLFTNWQLSLPTTLAPHQKKIKNKKNPFCLFVNLSTTWAQKKQKTFLSTAWAPKKRK